MIATPLNLKKITVALIGNPNCGKTSLFNEMSITHEHIEDEYEKTHIDIIRGELTYSNHYFTIYDLPGIYSLSDYTPESRYINQFLNEKNVDIVVNVVSSTDLERCLMLTTELIDADNKAVIALSMYDRLIDNGGHLDYQSLAEMMGIDIIPIYQRNKKALDQFLDIIINTSNNELKVRKIDFDSHRGRRQGYVVGALKETYTESKPEEEKTTRIIDSIVTHKVYGLPLFLLAMWLMFEATFKLGSYPMHWIESGVSLLGNFIEGLMTAGPLKDLIVNGIIGGVGGVIVFLPNILILYFCISFMEDSGYMARAAFIMDKYMHRIGLHGKSFIPLIMGFGCNVPAILASRTIESRSSRIITILINPFMSCSARLPVYVLLVGTFFTKYSGLVFFGLYVLGILIAIATAKLLRRFMFNEDETPFVMELPPYNVPKIKTSLSHMWDKAWEYLRKIGGIVLIASIAVWFLSYYPRADAHQIQAVSNMEVVASVDNQEVASQSENPVVAQQRNSYIGRIGRFCQPVVAPLGFDWKASVALLTGTAAKELIVSTLGVLYTGEEDNVASLSEKMKAPDPVTGAPSMTPMSALAFLIFVLLYFPCLATLAAIAHETGSWKYAIFSLVYSTALAWIVAWLAYNIGNLFV